MKKLGIKTPEEVKPWLSGSTSIEQVEKLHANGIKKVSDLEKWTALGVTNSQILELIEMDVKTPKELKKWMELGIGNVRNISLVKKMGFKNAKEFKPYMELDFNHIAVAKEANVKIDQLVISLSKSDLALGGRPFFKDKDTLLNVYNTVKKECKVVDTTLFGESDISKNKGNCYLFAAVMTKRDDSKSMLGKVTQKGLVTDVTQRDRVFYIDSFSGEWNQSSAKYGIIKGGVAHL